MMGYQPLLQLLHPMRSINNIPQLFFKDPFRSCDMNNRHSMMKKLLEIIQFLHKVYKYVPLKHVLRAIGIVNGPLLHQTQAH